MSTYAYLLLAAYVAAFFGALLGVKWWDRRKRRTRRPLPEDVKLLRMPGEYLWRRVLACDESDTQWGMIGIFIPILVGWAALYLAAWFFPSWLLTGLVGAVVISVFSLMLCVRWYQQRLNRRANDELGLFGERYVAEILDPLKASGWFIFHDLQCDGATGKFNLDHVAVGPGGVWVVETKTRRKSRARPGQQDYKIIFDGTKLIAPWFDGATAPLRQAENNAIWLNQWLQKMTGKDFPVRAVLTFPGYHVTEQNLGPVRVVYTKGIRETITGRGSNVLRPDEIDLIRRQLEAKCRDVEY